MKNNDRMPERIEIRIPGFAGAGTYNRAIAAAAVGGKIVFHTPPLLTVTKATNGEVFAKVHADRLGVHAGTVSYRIYGWMRCRVSG